MYLTNPTLIDLYTKKHLTHREIGEKLGISEQVVGYRLRKLGITAKDGQWSIVHCAFCNKELRRRRCLVRYQHKFYCNLDVCYAASREKPRRQESKIARVIVNQYFQLAPEHVVVYKDGDNKNTDRANLLVMSHQADARQRKGLVVLWDGSDV